MNWPDWFVHWLTSTPLQNTSGQMLRSVPGLPPILQTIHLLGITVLMASVVVLSLRTLNLAGRRQLLHEMSSRLFPWFILSLPVMLLSGLPFLFARPMRYLHNPMFTIKLLCLLLALFASGILWWQLRRQSPEATRVSWVIRGLAVVSLVSWISTALAGRWIAYADYIFWVE